MMEIKPILPFGTRTFIMGIINLTPDSFSGDGLMKSTDMVEAAVQQAARFVEEGADILDLGAESTRPGAEPVEADTELERLIPTLKRILELKLKAIISIDTYKATVAEQCLKAGANMINDVWGLKKDLRLAEVAARYAVPIVLMHNRSHSHFFQKSEALGGRYVGTSYQDLMKEICSDLQESITSAKRAGIQDQNIILDPGIGFGKTVEQNLTIIHHLTELRKLGFPILLGVSRKSFIGYTLDLPPEERLEGTAAAVAVGINNGADIIRVHDVRAMVRVARMCDAIVRN
ncbi:MAG: dihydropteroate synthase [Anaerolineaceae bacterium]